MESKLRRAPPCPAGSGLQEQNPVRVRGFALALTRPLARAELNKVPLKRFFQGSRFRIAVAPIHDCRPRMGDGIVGKPVRLARRPRVAPGPDRRLKSGEEERLLAVVAGDLGRAITLAIETGPSRGELLRLRWDDIDLTARTATIRNENGGAAGHTAIAASAGSAERPTSPCRLSCSLSTPDSRRSKTTRWPLAHTFCQLRGGRGGPFHLHRFPDFAVEGAAHHQRAEATLPSGAVATLKEKDAAVRK